MCDFRCIIIVAIISALSQITVQHRLRCGGFDCKDHEQCTVQLHGSNYFENCTEKCEHLGHCEPHHISNGHTCCCPDPHCLDSARREAEKHNGLICGHTVCHGHDKCMVSNRGQTKTCSRRCQELDDCDPHRVQEGHHCCCYDRHCLDRIHIEHVPAPQEHLTCPHCENYPHDCQDHAQPCPADHACVFIKEHDHRIHSECKPRHECDHHEVIQCCRTQDCVNNYGHTTPMNPTSPTTYTTPTTPPATTTVDHRVPCQICSDLLNQNCSNTNAHCNVGRKCFIHLHAGIISTGCIRQHASPCTQSSGTTTLAGEEYVCCSDMDCFNQAVKKFNSILLNAKPSSPTSTALLSPTTTSSTSHSISCSECSDFQTNNCTQLFLSCKSGENCFIRSNHNIISTKCIKEADCRSLKQSDTKSGGNVSSTCCSDGKCYIDTLVLLTNPVPALNHSTSSPSTTKISLTSPVPAINHTASFNSTTKIWLTVFNECKDRDESQMTCKRMDNDFGLCSSPNTVALALSKCRKYCGLCHYSTTPPIKTTQQPATVVKIG